MNDAVEGQRPIQWHLFEWQGWRWRSTLSLRSQTSLSSDPDPIKKAKKRKKAKTCIVDLLVAKTKLRGQIGKLILKSIKEGGKNWERAMVEI